VELDTQKLTQEDVERIEVLVNRDIRANKPVAVKDFKKTDSDSNRVTVNMEDANTSGPIRLIEIQGIDACTCCGTHVASTGDLQVMKFLQTEKTRGNTRLYFIVGNRVLKTMQRMLEVERSLTQLLNIGSTGHADTVDRQQKQAASTKRELKSANEEICVLLAANIALQQAEAPGQSLPPLLGCF